MTNSNKEKTGGFITLEEKQEVNYRAKKVLKQVKSNRLEKKKVPYRIDAKTVILVSPAKFKMLNNK